MSRCQLPCSPRVTLKQFEMGNDIMKKLMLRINQSKSWFQEQRCEVTWEYRFWDISDTTIYWLVVLNILKNISQWDELSHILWKIKNVPNHLYDCIYMCMYIYIYMCVCIIYIYMCIIYICVCVLYIYVITLYVYSSMGIYIYTLVLFRIFLGTWRV